MLVINLKNYPIDLDKFLKCLVDLVETKYPVDIVLCPSVAELSEVKKIVDDKIRVFAQHCDPKSGSKSTGFITAEKLHDIGIDGVILNHSEHRISLKEIEYTLEQLKNVGIPTVVGIERIEDISEMNFQPDYLLYEPSEYIGNSQMTNAKSVVEEKSSTLREMKNKFGDLEILIGAGVKSETDFEEIYRMDFAGVALSSIITESENIVEKLEEILMYEKNYGNN